MTYGPTLGALMTTTFAGSTPPRHRGRPSRRGRLAPRMVAVCAALAIAVTLAVAVGLASSAVARPVRIQPASPPQVVNAATADQPLKASVGPQLGPVSEVPHAKESVGPQLGPVSEVPGAAAAPSEESGFPWGAAAIGSGVALGLIGLAISRTRSRKRTGPAALSH